jgi:hypothetical protein
MMGKDDRKQSKGFPWLPTGHPCIGWEWRRQIFRERRVLLSQTEQENTQW